MQQGGVDVRRWGGGKAECREVERLGSGRRGGEWGNGRQRGGVVGVVDDDEEEDLDGVD